MKQFIITILLFTITFSASFAQENNSKTLLSIDDKNFSLEEFMYVYNKNNGGNTKIDDKSLEEYLDLYINFRLKVKEAEDRGMDTGDIFIRELQGYRTQLAKPYLTDKNIGDEILKEAYDRLMWDIRASHILITVPKDVSENDEVAKAAYNKLIDIRKRAVAGEDFGALAKEFSNDPSARDMPANRNRGALKGNGGDLGYFTAFYMVYPFETAAYETPVGEISMPIRTQFGYHIIKVSDKIKELGKIEVKHINVKPKSNDVAGDAKAKAKIEEIVSEINSGAKSFEEAAEQYSDDKGSAVKGGLLPAFEVSRMVPEFISAISKLEPEQVSPVVKTQYGYHIIKLVRTIKTPPYDEFLSSLQSKVNRDSRSNKSKAAAITKFKKEFKFKEYKKNKIKFYTAIDSSIYGNEWKASSAESYKKTLFILDKHKYTQQDFAKYVEVNQSMKQKGTFKYFTDKLYDQWLDYEVMAYKDSQLESQFPEFRMLVQEYHDGILLFAISDEEIWGKAIKDTTGLQEFYESNKANYMWKKRVEATVCQCATDSIAKKVSKLLLEKAPTDSIIRLMNKKSALNLHCQKGKFEVGTNPNLDLMETKVGVSKTLNNAKAFYVADITEIIEPTNKSIDEARGLITADFQNYLELRWIQKLKVEHKVIVNKELLK